MGRRLPFSAAIACLVTFGLFWTMQALIGVSGELKEPRPPPSIEFVRLRRDTTPEAKKREPPKREKPQQAPPPPDISMSKASFEPGDGVADFAPDIDPSAALSGGIGGGGGADRDIVPLVRISPEYPMRARQREIEGWATVGFTISKAGTVKDAFVVASHPGQVFDDAAVNAVRKWKYNPKIEQGKAVERPGVKVTLDFSMQN
jgi:protein TonB